MTRDELLALDDAALVRQCRVERHRASGPGGQHRNKVETAVRLTLLGHPDIAASGAECRSQKANLALALTRLRLETALALRSASAGPWKGDTKMNPANPRFPRLVAAVLDALAVENYELGGAALRLGFSVGQLRRLLAREPRISEAVNRERALRGLSMLRT